MHQSPNCSKVSPQKLFKIQLISFTSNVDLECLCLSIFTSFNLLLKSKRCKSLLAPYPPRTRPLASKAVGETAITDFLLLSIHSVTSAVTGPITVQLPPSLSLKDSSSGIIRKHDGFDVSQLCSLGMSNWVSPLYFISQVFVI